MIMLMVMEGVEVAKEKYFSLGSSYGITDDDDCDTRSESHLPIDNCELRNDKRRFYVNQVVNSADNAPHLGECFMGGASKKRPLIGHFLIY